MEKSTAQGNPAQYFQQKSLPIRDTTENYCKMHNFAVTCESDQFRFAKDPNVADRIYKLVDLQNPHNSADFCHIPINFHIGTQASNSYSYLTQLLKLAKSVFKTISKLT